MKLPAHFIANQSPEVQAALKHKRARLAAESNRLPPADRAPMFLAAWNLTHTHPDQPAAEFPFHDTRGWRFDFAWPVQCVAVEVDGGQHAAGGGRHATDGDRDKLNEAAAKGWLVFRFSPEQLETAPAQCVELVEAALRLSDL